MVDAERPQQLDKAKKIKNADTQMTILMNKWGGGGCSILKKFGIETQDTKTFGIETGIEIQYFQHILVSVSK